MSARDVAYGAVPSWWVGLAAPASRFAHPEWLAATGSGVDDRQVWIRSAAGDSAVGVRCVLVDAEHHSRSTDVLAHLTTRTPYFTPDERGTARHARLRARVGPGDVYPSLVALLPGLETFLVGPEPAVTDPALVDDVIAAVVATADRAGARTCCFLFVQPEDVPLADGLQRAGFRPVKVAVRSNLTVGASYDGYLSSLSANERSSIRRTRRRLAAAGVHVSLADPVDTWLPAVAALRVAHLERHGRPASYPAEFAELRALVASFPGATKVFVAERAGSLRGYALFFDDGRVWHAMSTGFSTDDDDRDVYFEVMYHAPIEERCRTGGGTLSFGYGTEEPKRRRGCEQRVVSCWLRGVAGDGRLPWLDADVAAAPAPRAGATAGVAS